MKDSIRKELSKEKQSEFHKKLLSHCKDLVSLSRNTMSNYYGVWDNRHQVYKGEKPQNADDKKSKSKGEPGKIAIPLTYAQIQTFIAFATSLLQQKPVFFDVEGSGEEDQDSAKLAEALLERDLNYNNISAKLYQFFLDISRFGLGVIKHSWVEEKETVWVKKEVEQQGGPLSVFGKMFGLGEPAPVVEEEVAEERVRYQGNKLESVNPYRFYPDTRLPISRFQEGEFCASESEVSRNALKKGEQSGLYAGVEFVQDMSEKGISERKGSNFTNLGVSKKGNFTTRASSNVNNTVVLTEVQVELVPSEFEIADGEMMGESDQVEKWLVVYANDSRVIRAEPLGYVHNNFTYTVSQFSHDQHELLSETISDMISHLQGVVDWFINSHITNVRKHVQNKLLVDPKAVYYEDIVNHKPVIRLKASASGKPLDRVLKQLDVSDVTRNHVGDANMLAQFMSTVTSVSENMLGQYSKGRRSAREAGNISQASGARLRMVVKIIFDTGLKGMGEDMISNLRDGLSEKTFVEVTGELSDIEAFEHFTSRKGTNKVGVDRTHLSGRFDFQTFEGSLPSDKYQQADTLQQVLLSMFSAGPEGVQMMTQMLGYDPGKLFKEVLELRGIKHPNKFKIDAFRQQELQQLEQQRLEQENGLTPTGDVGAGNPQQPVVAGQPGLSSLIG